jgi:hypothetical protein
MANKTTNYGLTKPLPEDFYDINVQNENMDKIDAELKKKYDRNNKPSASDIGAAPVGFGLGAAATSISGTDLLDTLKTGKSGWFRGNDVTNAPTKSTSDWYYFNVIADSADYSCVFAYSYNGTMYRAFYANGNLYAWKKIYDEANKPALADIGAASASDFNNHVGNKSNPHKVTAEQISAVPTTRKVNGKTLNADISINASDVGARPNTWLPSASDVGLGNVNNTSDANKPVSTAQATAIADAKKAGTNAQTNLTNHINDKSNPHGVTAEQVGARPNTWLPKISELDCELATDLKAINKHCRVRYDVSTLNTPYNNGSDPPVTGFATGICDVVYSTSYTALFCYCGNGEIYANYYYREKWSGWKRFYHEGFNPTADKVGAVPITRTVNGKALSSDISLNVTDVGAAPAYTYSTEDLIAGESPLETGKLYFVYE